MYIEKNCRLANSKLWALQKSAYNLFGPQAWDSKKVPSYITTSPLIAKRYASVVLGFIRDGLAGNNAMTIDLNHPFYIFDLGAGTGRFGFLFLKTLFSFFSLLKIPLRIQYVMTDMATGNLEYLQQHTHLEPYRKSGILDFCLYTQDQEHIELKLIQHQKILKTGSFINPIVLIANYFFDTLPHDLFRVQNHQLEEGKISLTYEFEQEKSLLNLDDPRIIPHLKMEKEYAPLDNFYSNYSMDWIELLREYSIQYENIPQLLFPLGAFQVIQFFRQLSEDKFLLLASDQGVHSPLQLVVETPFFSQHDSFSIHVNYHAIKRYFQKKEGCCWETSNLDPMLVNFAATIKGQYFQFPELSHAFEESMKNFEISDYYQLTNQVLELGNSASLTMILKLIKLGNGDPWDFQLFFSKILNAVTKIDEKMHEELFSLLEEVASNFYPIGNQSGSFIMNLGVLCYNMKKYTEALKYFEESLKMGYQDPLIFKNIAATRRSIFK